MAHSAYEQGEWNMTDFEVKFIDAIEDYYSDYGADAVLEEFFPKMTIGEVILDAYNSGLIPTDLMEKFLND